MIQWDDCYIIKAYELSRAGITGKRFYSSLGISEIIFNQFIVKHPALRKAVKKGLKCYYNKTTSLSNFNSKNIFSFQDFVFQNLPDNIRKYWDKLNQVSCWICQECNNSFSKRPAKTCPNCGNEIFNKRRSVDKIEALMAEGGEKIRKWLFLYAWVCDNTFSLPMALAKVNISRQTFERWKNEDDDFKKAFESFVDYKYDFIEDAVMDLVAMREPGTVKWAADRLLKLRGYGEEKTNINIIQQNLLANVLSAEEALKDLPLEQQKAILENIRRKQIEGVVVRE
jgi:DNA-directed RNA polymerase subunit RPC12/RpoP